MKIKEEFCTDLKRATGLGAAKEGTNHFLYQRITSVSNLVLFAGFVFIVFSLSEKDAAQMKAMLSQPFIGLFMILMLVSGVYHMKLGMQVIIEDYISCSLMRPLFLMANIFFCFAIAALSILAVLKIMFGG